jgi:hypothetical protein
MPKDTDTFAATGVNAHHPSATFSLTSAHVPGVMTAHPGWVDPGLVSGSERDVQVTPELEADADAVTNGEPYVISIRGCLGASLSASFAPMRVSTGNGRTELRGFVQDQAALYGILVRIQSLGLQLDEVIRLGNPSRRGTER